MARWKPHTLRQWDQVVCPECQNDLDVQEDEVLEGETIGCPNCGEAFEVMKNPFELRRVEDFDPTPGLRPAA